MMKAPEMATRFSSDKGLTDVTSRRAHIPHSGFKNVSTDQRQVPRMCSVQLRRIDVPLPLDSRLAGLVVASCLTGGEAGQNDSHLEPSSNMSHPRLILR